MKEPMITMLHKIETYNKDIKNFLKNRLEILMLSSTITEIYKLLQELNTRFKLAKGKISGLNYKSIDIL